MRTPTTTAPVRTRARGPFGDPNYGNRQTRPDYFNAFAGGMGIVPRRGWDERTTRFVTESAASPVRALHRWATSLPLLVLSVLIDVHPLGQLALSNDLSLAFSNGSTRIVAAESDDPAASTNDEGTAVIEDLWRSLPPDLGGLVGLQWTLGEQASKTGMWAFEAVPGAAGDGIVDAPDFSPLSLRFRDTDSGRVLEQEQIGNLNTLSSVVPGWEALDTTFCLTGSWRGSRNNPYGAPRYGAFLSEGLADVSEQRDLRDWLHSVAWPRLAVTFPYDKVVEYAREHPDLLAGAGPDGRDMTETEYASLQFAAFAAKLQGLKADDIMMLPMGAEAKALTMTAQGLVDIYDRRRLRLIQSLDQLPNLMGVTDGGTQAYATEQSRVYYNKLEAFRAFVNRGPVALANLHLRLLGLPFVARAETERIQPRDRVTEARAEGLEIGNAERLLDNGVIGPEDFAQRLSSSGVFDEARLLAASRARTARNVTPPRDPERDPGRDPNGDPTDA